MRPPLPPPPLAPPPLPAQCRPASCATPRREAFEGPLAIDLGNLMACDISPLDAAAFEGGPAATDEACHRLAQTIFQSLAARLFALPSEAAPVGRIAQLPPPTTVLPREKPIPKARPPTKWEVFAQVSGGRREGEGW